MKILFTFLSLFMTITLFGQTIIPFDNPMPAAPMNCNDSWTESGIPQQVIPIPPDPTCNFDYSGGGVWLFAAQITFDLTSLSNITSIEVDVIDNCALGCSQAIIYSNNVSVDTLKNTLSTGVPETMTFNNSNMIPLNQLKINSYEGQFLEVRIFQGQSQGCNDPADPQVRVEDGDVYLEDSCNGVILTSPNGTCYRLRIDDNGDIISEQVTCPQ